MAEGNLVDRREQARQHERGVGGARRGQEELATAAAAGAARAARACAADAATRLEVAQHYEAHNYELRLTT